MIHLAGSIFSKLLSKPDTRRYPMERRPVAPGTRGHIDIEIEKCIFCGACQKRCPSNALEVSRDSKAWILNRYACIVCGYCVEICPKKCIRMNDTHHTPGA